MSEDGWRWKRQGTVDDAEIGMTNATMTNANENLTATGIVDLARSSWASRRPSPMVTK
jgi:hypothetical protein